MYQKLDWISLNWFKYLVSKQSDFDFSYFILVLYKISKINLIFIISNYKLLKEKSTFLSQEFKKINNNKV